MRIQRKVLIPIEGIQRFLRGEVNGCGHKAKPKVEPTPETEEQGQLRETLKTALMAQVKAGGSDGIKAAIALGRFEGLLRSPAPAEEGQQITESDG